MNILDVTPRQPVRVQTPFHEFIGVLWPCKELGVLRLSLTGENATNEKLISVFPIYKPHRLRRVSISFKTIPHKINNFLEDYIQMYLNNTYVQPGLPIPMNYYGKVIYIVPDIPVDFLFKNISLEDEELNTAEPVVFFLTSDCTISISVPSIETTSSTDPLSALSLIGGMHTAKKTLLDFVLTPFWSRRSCCSVLLWGLPGSGKTLLLSTVAKILGANAYYFQSMDEFYEQCSLIPELCVVILDWPLLDKEHKCFSKLARLIDGNLCTGVILSVRQAEDLDIGIRVRFPIEVEVDVPMEIERLEILRSLANSFPDDALVEVAKRTSGFTGGDLKSLVIASQFIEGQSAGERLEQARRRVRPTGIRQFILEVREMTTFFLLIIVRRGVQVPHVSWEDIGGCEELKLEIQQAVIWPQQHKEAFERLGIEPPTGILLYGPPGCSKTLVARALANESNMNFLAVKGPELFSKWVGESEKAIRDLFARARQVVAPAIVFFDEIDAVGSSRGSEKSSGVSDRVLAQLLTELDGLEKQNDVLLLAATNRPDQLDNALLRPVAMSFFGASFI
ncbi:ATPase, AAA family [Dictyocaulus viviparus]|uniref:ATPase, AAA family n=1 Tax=Dictyocaulus viviparus TaxID=29172 RepID=A0A0D8XN10_DICVI|nr:ATPase, AAA family [Dictyocaulus viviparus]